MCKHNIGDVIWGVVALSERNGVKPRPVIIIDININECRYFVVHCYSLQEKHGKQKGFEVLNNTREFVECGFSNDTFISCGCRSWIPEKLLVKHPDTDKKPMGFCSFINSLKECAKR